MIIGVPKEIKTNENRIALVPGGAEALVQAGHTVLVERTAAKAAASDAAYEAPVRRSSVPPTTCGRRPT
jgi:alanine dehydrogenase